MDIKQAIEAHVEWKMKLARYLAKPDKSLDPNRIRPNNLCELGKWLEGEGQ